MRSRLARNASSGYVALAWMSALSLLTIPIYVRLLGADEWGLVAACASLQLIFNFVDSGFSQIVPRWIARAHATEAASGGFIRLFRRIYLVLGLAGWLLLQASAAPLAQRWFDVGVERQAELEWAIRIISFQLVFQFLNSLNIGIWNGRQQQLLANARTCAFATAKHAIALATVALYQPLAWAYATAFAAVALAELLANNKTARAARNDALPDDRVGAIERAKFLREVATLSAGVLVGLLCSQLDRIVVSAAVSVVDFGVYVVVANLALAVLQLQMPLTRAYFPRLVQEFGQQGGLSTRTLHTFLAGNVLVGALPALLASLYAEELIHAWIGDAYFVEVGKIPLKMLLWSVAINIIYGCFYQAIVACGQARLVLAINIVALSVGVLVVLGMNDEAGLVVGSTIWLATTSTQLALGLGWYVLKLRQHRKDS